MKALISRVCRPAAFVILGLLIPPAALADYTATGRFQYEDREFNINGFTGVVTPRPIRFANVLIMAGNTQIATGATGVDGSFSVGVSGTAAQQITAICVTSSSQTPNIFFEVRAAANDSYNLNGDLYSVASALQIATGTTPVDFGTTLATADTDAGKAFNIWDVVNDSLQFVASSSAAGGYPTQKLTVSWSSNQNRTGSFFAYDGTNRAIYVGVIDYSDDTVIAHEFGHYIDNLYFKSDSPGGSHYLGDDTQDIRLSWGEGLATFLGCSSRKFKGYPTPEIYVSTDGKNLNFSYELENLTGIAAIGSKTGSTNEVAVTATLWDITDTDDDYPPGVGDHDPVYRPFGDVWKVLSQYFPTVTRPGISIETFWIGWLATFNPAGSDLKALQDTFTGVFNGVDTGMNGIEYLRDAQEPDDTPAQAPLLVAAQGPALLSGPKVVISELDLGAVDTVELYNAGNVEADLTGWRMEASAPTGLPTIFTLPAFRLAPGAFLVLSEAAGANTNSTLYFNNNISWANGSDGACALTDSKGAGIDFVRWGNSATPVPAGTSFSGQNPASPPIGRNLARAFAEIDTDSGSDWTSQTSTLGSYNISGQEKHHTYYPIGDVDYMAFNAAAGNYYLAETLHLFNGADTILDIISSDGITVLATNDDLGTARASRLAWRAPANGKCYLRSRRFDGTSNFAQFGSYDLRLMQSASPFTLALPQTLTVSQPGQGGKFQRVTDAIVAASNGDTIQIIDNGSYAETLSLSGKGLILRVTAGKNPVIDGRGSSATATLIIANAKTVMIDGLTILAGRAGMTIQGGNVTISNSVITGASDPRFADGIDVSGLNSNATIINCTILNNGRSGVGVFSKASVKISNSIIRNNATVDVGGDGLAASLVVKNSLVGSGGFSGFNGNINGDPQFVDPSNNNYRLKSTSPAIDAGDPSDPDLPPIDADGLPRSIDGRGTGRAVPDMGAYEYLSPGTLTSTTILPQVAAGGSPAYRTSIMGINTGSLAAVADLSLTKSDGTPFPITIINAPEMFPGSAFEPETGAAAGRSGSSYNFAIPAGGMVRYEMSAPGDTTAGYATLVSNVPIVGTAMFMTMNGDTIQSEAEVGLSRSTRSFLVYLDDTNNANSGYAVANYGSTPATLTMTLRDAGGNQQAPVKLITLPAYHQMAKFAAGNDQFATAAASLEGSIEFSSDQNVAAVALRYDNPAQDVFSTIPVLVDETSTTLYFPQAVDGGTYRTDFVLVNPSTTPTLAHLEFFKDDGNPLGLTIGTDIRTSFDIALGAKGAAHLITEGTPPSANAGWVRITSPVAIGGSAIFQTVSGSRILSEAGVPASPSATHSIAHVSSMGYTESGLAICNPNSIAVTVTLKLRDVAGQVVGSTTVSLGPLGHIARFFTQWFPTGAADFEGTLEVVATGPVSAVALRYDNSQQNVFAALPVIVIP